MDLKSIEQRKRAAIVALNRYFKVERDEVDQYTSISLKVKMHTSFGVEFDVLCYVTKENPIPDKISFHISSTSSDWKYLDGSRFVVRWPNHTNEFEKLDVKTKVLTDGYVVEQMFADFSFNEFRSMASAPWVIAKLRSDSFEFNKEYRDEWGVLFYYFDTLKAEQEAQAK